MSGKQAVSTSTTVKTETKTSSDGPKETKTTTTTVTKYSDGSQSTEIKIETVTEGCKVGQANTEQKQTEQKAETSQAPQTSSPKDASVSKGISGGKTEDKFIFEAQRAHNEYRAKHGSPPLVICPMLVRIAQDWADKIAAKKKMEHSTTNYGENVFWSTNPGVDGTTAVHSWYREIDGFNFNKMEPQKGTGHFTQLIWKTTKRFGIAKAVDSDGTVYIVANYDPAGNFVGQYADNISKAK